jgi:hypothetical protein
MPGPVADAPAPHRIGQRQSAMIEYLLEFHGRIGGPVCRQKRLAAHIRRIEAAKECLEAERRDGELVWTDGAKQIDRRVCRPCIQRDLSAKRRQGIGTYRGVLGKAFVQVVGRV